MTAEQTVYKDGIDAYIKGMSIDANPYSKEHDSSMYRAWRNGWIEEYCYVMNSGSSKRPPLNSLNEPINAD